MNPFNDPTSPLYDPPTQSTPNGRRNYHLVKYDLAPLIAGTVPFLDFHPEPGKHQSVRNAASNYGRRNRVRFTVALINQNTLRISVATN